MDNIAKLYTVLKKIFKLTLPRNMKSNGSIEWRIS